MRDAPCGIRVQTITYMRTITYYVIVCIFSCANDYIYVNDCTFLGDGGDTARKSLETEHVKCAEYRRVMN